MISFLLISNMPSLQTRCYFYLSRMEQAHANKLFYEGWNQGCLTPSLLPCVLSDPLHVFNLHTPYQPLPKISCRNITAAMLHGCKKQQERNLLLAQHQQTVLALGSGVFYREVNALLKLDSPLMYQHYSVNVSS